MRGKNIFAEAIKCLKNKGIEMRNVIELLVYCNIKELIRLMFFARGGKMASSKCFKDRSWSSPSL